MAVTAKAVISGNITGLPGGTVTVGPITDTVGTPSALAGLQGIDLTSGANTISVPADATVMIFVPPAANTQTLTLKGVSGDTGIAMSKTQATKLALAAGAAVVITAGGAVAGCELIFM